VAFPKLNFLNASDVGISAGNIGLSQITLPGKTKCALASERVDAESVFFVMIALAIVLDAERPDA
jgi:hypothetical protein